MRHRSSSTSIRETFAESKKETFMKCSNYLLLFQWELAIDIHFHFISFPTTDFKYHSVRCICEWEKVAFITFMSFFRNLIKKNPINLLGWAQSIRTCWGGCETSAEDIKKLFPFSEETWRWAKPKRQKKNWNCFGNKKRKPFCGFYCSASHSWNHNWILRDKAESTIFHFLLHLPKWAFFGRKQSSIFCIPFHFRPP